MASARQPQDRKCYEVQVNRRVPDFTCDIVGPGHNVHRDPRTGTRWGHRSPMRKKRGSNTK